MRTEKKHRNNSNQRGAALVFFLFSLFAIVAILAIVIDLGRFETIIRSLQHSADAAALNAAATLQVDDTFAKGIVIDPVISPDADDILAEARRSANVKKIVLSILAQGEMIGLDGDAKLGLCIDEPDPAVCSADAAKFRFDDIGSDPSGPDWLGYGRISGSRGNLKVTVQRMIFCYSGNSDNPVRNYINTDDPDWADRLSHFCKANAVKVTLTLSHINIFFGRLLGVTELSSVTVSSIAVTNEDKHTTAGICQSTTCSYAGVPGYLDGGSVWGCTSGPVAVP